MTTRVLLVSHETTLSGAPIQLVYLAKWLREHGWQVVVAAPEDGPIVEKLRSVEVEIVIAPDLLLEPDHQTLRRLTSESHAVVANTIATWRAVQAAHVESVPVVWYLHETLAGRRLARLIPEIRPALGRADALVAPTRSTAAVYELFTRQPIDVIAYGIPPVNVSVPASDSDRTRFVTLGTFERRKGQDVLMEALASLAPEVREQAVFQLAGRNLEELFYESVQRKAAELSNVKFPGALDHEHSLKSLAGSDVLVIPSRDETMPVVILEAMSLGKAIITTDVGGIREWVQAGMNGLLVPPENPAALARAIERCITEPELIKRLGRTARRTYAEHFTLDRYGADFARVIERTIEEKHSASLMAKAHDWGTLYEKWVKAYDTFASADRLALQRELRQLREQPLISIILPVYNSDLSQLRDALDSVKRQVYERWELCIADDASTDPRVRAFLEEEAVVESRIRLSFRERNGQIAACSNSALELATGEWCALLDQDDLLAEHALAHVAREIGAHPDAGLIYSDEDKIDLTGIRSSPFFKPDWNPELFLAQNYINHLGVYRASLLREIGGFREGFEGSQDYDLALRCVGRLPRESIRHIPRVLYHWRTAPGSLAALATAKPHAKEAARRAIRHHLERRGVAARVEPCPENVESHRVIYDLPESLPFVSVVIPTRDRVDLLQRCLTSLRRTTDYAAFEVIVVDHGSSEPEALEYLQSLKLKENFSVLHERGRFNFSRLNNVGAKEARGSMLAFLNNDIEVTEPSWLREMVSHAARPEVGAVGARLWYPEQTLQHGGVVLGLGGVAGHAHHLVPRGHPGYFNRALLQQNCSAVTAACLVVRKSIFDELGGFDETNVGINFNDVDFCLRLRARGLQVVWTPYAELLHHESGSRGSRPSRAQQELFLREATYMQKRWGADLLRDPYYSPNLCLELPAFYPAFPPRRLESSFSRLR